MRLFALALVPLLHPVAHATEAAASGPPNRVWVVDANGFGDFTDLQAAIDSAASGDTLLVRNSPEGCCNSSYGGFEIDGKSLSLIGTAPGPHFIAHGTVRNLPPGGVVVLSGLDLNWESHGLFQTPIRSLRVLNCAGSVRVQNCRIEGYGRSNNSYVDSRGAVRVASSQDVTFDGCEMRGGDGGYKYVTEPASEGLSIQGAQVSLYHTIVSGGEGGGYSSFPFLYGLDGGPGITLETGDLYLSSCTVAGGPGGSGDFGGDGGHGLSVGSGASAWARNTAIFPGPGGDFGGDDGNAVTGLLHEVTTGELGLDTPQRLPEGSPLSILVTGAPGDQAGLVVSAQTLARFVGPTEGYVHTGSPITGGAIDLGTLPADGSISIELTSLPGVPADGSLLLFVQAALTTPGEAPRRTEVAAVEVLDDGVFRDCTGPIFVDVSAPAGGDGTSWTTAFNRLDAALAAVADCREGAAEIWVARGTYCPDEPGGDRERRFEVSPGTRLLGGFAGHETRADERQPGTYRTVLSADLNQDDHSGGGTADNAYQVMEVGSFSAPVERVVLDGLTVEGSELSGAFSQRGGGLQVSGDVDLYNMIIRDNRARRGGGMNVLGGHLRLVNCQLIGNEGTGYGGGIYVQTAQPTVEIVQSVFVGNRSNLGGAVFTSSGLLDIRNSTIARNISPNGAGGVHAWFGNTATLSNSILWANRSGTLTRQDAQVESTGAQVVLQNCCVQHLDGSLGGRGNIAGDPAFLGRPGTGGQAGAEGYDLRLGPGSACVDRGSNELTAPDTADLDRDGDTREFLPLDISGRPRFVVGAARELGAWKGPVVDIGAHEAPVPRPRSAIER